MSVLVSAGSFRASFQLTCTAPVTGSTDSHWLNWSLTTPDGSSLTRTGLLHVLPRSVEFATKMSVPLLAVSSIHEQYSVPRCAPALWSLPQAGYSSAPRVAWGGIVAANGTTVGAIVL